MRLNSLEIKSAWKNLEGLVVDFDENEDVTVLIGRNGAAKSNLLESLITIFRDISLDEPAAISYCLQYTLNGQHIEVSAVEGTQPSAKLDGKRLARKKLREECTPRFLVAYYSGQSDRFEELFRRHDRRALDETLVDAKESSGPSQLTFRRFIYARPEHGLFSLLAFYFSEDKVIQQFLKRLPRISGFDSALLVAHKPRWARKGATADDFWGARGPVRELLERMRDHSLAPLSRVVTVDLDFRRKEKRELIYLYLPNLNAVASLAEGYSRDPRALFQALDTMRLSDLLEDFRVRVRVVGAADAIHTRELSEGEQQLLTVLGLMRFTSNDESLYLLDEPDTHLNPAWAVDYLENLRNVAGLHQNSHTLLATHDPLLVAGLRREEIRALYRGSSGRIVAEQPEESPRGTGVASVLTSPLYGLDSQLDPFSLRVLKRIYDVSMDEPSDKRIRHLERLRRLVPALELLESSPDPFRNIAKEAYQLALDRAVAADELASHRSEIVERLAAMMFDEAANIE